MQSNQSQNIYRICYSVGIATLIFQAIFTVYQLSNTISDGQKIAQLQRVQQQLSAQQTQAEQSATALVAISQVEAQLPAGFEPVAKPLIIHTSDSVASRE